VFPDARPKPVPQSQGPGLGGGIRTMCVRLCDGYYWPLSWNASRGRLLRDSKACQSSCGSEARLFTMTSNGDPRDMVDLAGRPYAKLPNAFRYRKGEVAACRCRPESWEQSELERHRGYAAPSAGRDEAATVQLGSMTAFAAPTAPTAPLPDRRAALVELERIALAGALVGPSARRPELLSAAPVPTPAPSMLAETAPAAAVGGEVSESSVAALAEAADGSQVADAEPAPAAAASRPPAKRRLAAPPPYDVARLHAVTRAGPGPQVVRAHAMAQPPAAPVRASYRPGPAVMPYPAGRRPAAARRAI
jgi:hypothetical protein